MTRKRKNHPKLQRLYKDIIEHEIFDVIRDYDITLVFSSVQLGGDSWADCGATGPEQYYIRVHASLKLINAPDYVFAYLIGHELIHAIPGCWNHNDKFYTLERKLTGDNFYEANVWLKQNLHIVKRDYNYREKGWLVRQIKDQMRIKDMAAICSCSVSTIKRWLRKYDLWITY